ncbi:MAG TPA: type IX secretion system membrane protein PorP/SprF [Flavobacteriales bacterium]|jgi:type IX secretion system PorP/SprF family membrane protein|nr:type IX secretion system membrane protein PorP/SprF [Flavobacteriales bacterium]HIA06785.1 type IX secretion system membrane protein PorP/SprF [Flavobacteriales bacterium]
MKAKLPLLFVLVCMYGGTSVAQQEPQFQHNMFNHLTTNPGYAGSNGAICANILVRNQWMGFVGSPQTGLLNVEAPVKFLKGGVGVTIITDELGLQSTMYTKLAYAFRTSLKAGDLGIGIRAGLTNTQIDGSRFEPFDKGSDPTIPLDAVSGGAPTFGFGVYFSNPGYYLGVSSTQLTESVAGLSADLDYDLKRHYYATAGLTTRLTSDLELKPSVFFKFNAGVPPQFDLSALLLYNNQFWAGVGYRAMDMDAVPTYVGVLWNNLKIGYSYDIALNGLRGFNSGSHEVYVGYCFKLNEKVTAQRYRNVRFL